MLAGELDCDCDVELRGRCRVGGDYRQFRLRLVRVCRIYGGE